MNKVCGRARAVHVFGCETGFDFLPFLGFPAGLLLYASLVILAVRLRVIDYAEPTLERCFGASFRWHRREVPCWLIRPH